MLRAIALALALVLAPAVSAHANPEWDTYAETEIDLMLNMAAHVEQAWVEAKRTGDDTVRQSAKAPRRRLDEAPQILDKLARCAESNGATANPGAIFRRIERDLPKRQAEIALPR
jgi:hypothetical protein